MPAVIMHLKSLHPANSSTDGRIQKRILFTKSELFLTPKFKRKSISHHDTLARCWKRWVSCKRRQLLKSVTRRARRAREEIGRSPCPLPLLQVFEGCSSPCCRWFCTIWLCFILFLVFPWCLLRWGVGGCVGVSCLPSNPLHNHSRQLTSTCSCSSKANIPKFSVGGTCQAGLWQRESRFVLSGL